MRSMRERATKIGGTLIIKSAPGQETCIRVSVPLAEGREVSLVNAHNQI